MGKLIWGYKGPDPWAEFQKQIWEAQQKTMESLLKDMQQRRERLAAERRQRQVTLGHAALGVAHLAFLFVAVQAMQEMVELWR